MEPSALIASGCLEAHPDGVVVRLHVQPRASRNGFAGLHGDSVKLRITAPPVDGKANDLIVEVLAKTFGVAKSAVTMVSGQQSRQKRFRVAGLDLDRAVAALAAAA